MCLDHSVPPHTLSSVHFRMESAQFVQKCVRATVHILALRYISHVQWAPFGAGATSTLFFSKYAFSAERRREREREKERERERKKERERERKRERERERERERKREISRKLKMTPFILYFNTRNRQQNFVCCWRRF